MPSLAGADDVIPYGVSCPATDACIAVGIAIFDDPDFVRGFAAAWDGSTWRLLDTPLPPGASHFSLDDVDCVAVDRCVAVGGSDGAPGEPHEPLGAHWNGAKWSYRESPADAASTHMIGVSCASKTCVSVGVRALGGPAIQRFATGTWTTEVPAPASGASLIGVSCSTQDRCVAVGGAVGPHIQRSS